MKKLFQCMASLMMIAIVLPLYAIERPTPLPDDHRLYQIAYQQNNVVPLKGIVLNNTQIVFGEGETVIDVEMGNPIKWSWHVNRYQQNVLNIKPTRFDSNTNMQVITKDGEGQTRYYYFHLTTDKTPSKNKSNAIYAIHFYYPALEKRKRLEATRKKQIEKQNEIHPFLHPRRYNWNYQVNGAWQIVPKHVFDDGKFTYMEFHHNQTIPAIFAVNNPQGEEAVVNYHKQGAYIVIDQVAPQFTLREGKHLVAGVFNKKWIGFIHHARKHRHH